MAHLGGTFDGSKIDVGPLPLAAPRNIPPAFDLGSGVVVPEEQRFSNSSRTRPLKLSQKPFGMGFPGAM
jgi:hypothetical protein